MVLGSGRVGQRAVLGQIQRDQIHVHQIVEHVLQKFDVQYFVQTKFGAQAQRRPPQQSIEQRGYAVVIAVVVQLDIVGARLQQQAHTLFELSFPLVAANFADLFKKHRLDQLVPLEQRLDAQLSLVVQRVHMSSETALFQHQKQNSRQTLRIGVLGEHFFALGKFALGRLFIEQTVEGSVAGGRLTLPRILQYVEHGVDVFVERRGAGRVEQTGHALTVQIGQQIDQAVFGLELDGVVDELVVLVGPKRRANMSTSSRHSAAIMGDTGLSSKPVCSSSRLQSNHFLSASRDRLFI
ncbi:hypothetical protein BpHYR1_010790 [Brachionus plicatilis]|uniref:Uncharacterized protein n=1 Tax=Brachionus plicatilis TaxID=10195 RepID=A0A3M7QVD4_BRAPC|nr:hypothetical protein BpHYR1_010790 [Brachionus plicatilis]